MYTSSTLKLGAALMLILALAMPGQSKTKGPEHRTLRPLGMGNAFVAVVDDKDALHYNPAGLNLLGRLGNKKRRPEMGFYPSDYIDMHMNFLGLGLPLGTALDVYQVYQNHDSTFTNASLEALQDDSTLITDLVVFDRQPIPFAVLSGGELAFHNFGMSYWADVRVSPYLDVGVILPQAGFERIQADVAGEIGLAHSFMHDRLAIGVAYRMARRVVIKNVQISLADIPNINDIVQDTVEARLELLQDVSRIGHGFDFGVLWQQTRELRFGAVLQNAFMKLNNEAVIPELTMGLVYSPRILQNNFRWKRKINFALDYEDALNDERGYKWTSKINAGMEWEQTLIPYIIKGRLSGGVKGGYPTFGVGGTLFTLLHFEFATWADEIGYYTGQQEDRYYVMNFGIGF